MPAVVSSSFITLEQRQQQRRHIYRALEQLLTHHPFQLVLPVNVILNSAWDGHSEYCHGFGEYWCQHGDFYRSITDYKAWPTLTGTEIFWLDGLTLNPDIEQSQMNQKFSMRKKLTFKHLGHDKDLLSQIEQLIDYKKLEPGTLFVFDLNRALDRNQLCCIPLLWACKAKPICQWHEIRLIYDYESQWHIFDANIGAFRSTQALMKFDQVAEFINSLFELLGYHQKYGIVRLSKQQSLERTAYPAQPPAPSKCSR